MRRKTYVVDVDGVIFRHHDAGSVDQWTSYELLSGTLEWFDAREKESACVVLMTARKECCRLDLEEALRVHGLFWDHLVMGVGNGPRILINDARPDAPEDWAVAVELERNRGLC